MLGWLTDCRISSSRVQSQCEWWMVWWWLIGASFKTALIRANKSIKYMQSHDQHEFTVSNDLEGLGSNLWSKKNSGRKTLCCRSAIICTSDFSRSANCLWRQENLSLRYQCFLSAVWESWNAVGNFTHYNLQFFKIFTNYGNNSTLNPGLDILLKTNNNTTSSKSSFIFWIGDKIYSSCLYIY